MTTPDVSNYASIQSNLFVRIAIDEYQATPNAGYTSQVLRFSDMLTPFTINSESYLGVGRLMSISETTSELRVTGNTLTITLGGIPNSSIYEIINSKVKGSSIKVYRALFNSATGAFLSITGNPMGRFDGFINNYSLNEEYDPMARTATNTLVLTCASKIDSLSNKVAGRRTNPESQKKYFSTDPSMDRIPNLVDADFNFGAPL
jgi:hypothetical protein